MDLSTWPDILQSSLDRLHENTHFFAALGITGGIVVLSGAYLLFRSQKTSQPSKLRGFDIRGGSIDRKAIRQAFLDYNHAFGREGAGMVDKSQTVKLVDTYYNLVTDFYEWGWGDNFNLYVRMPGKSELASETAAIARIATLCKLRSGMKCIDCGCGIGGPMRTVAAFSGAEVTGVTINQHQVDRANYHNRRHGLDSLCRAIQGTFLKLEFPDDSFDAAYACAATCHAPDVSVAYGEVFRVIKPGSTFVSYEWVTTPLFDAANPVHVQAIDDINYGNGLPELRSAAACIEAAKSVGFELVMEYDAARESGVCSAWYTRLDNLCRSTALLNRFIVGFLSTFGLLPSGMKEVHDMLLYSAAEGLITGGKEGIFTPMHLLVFQKPEA